MLKLSAKAIKTTLVVDPGSLLGAKVPPSASRVPFQIAVGQRKVTGEFNAKSLRPAIAAIEAGDAGISAMPKVKKEAA